MINFTDNNYNWRWLLGQIANVSQPSIAFLTCYAFARSKTPYNFRVKKAAASSSNDIISLTNETIHKRYEKKNDFLK